MRKRSLALLGALVVVAACSTPQFAAPPGPQDYRVGFHDGCDAGYAWAGSPFYPASNATEPERTDEPYRTGWKAGFSRCLRHYQRIQSTVNAWFGPP